MTTWVNIADILASIATFGALLAVIYEISKTRDIEKRQASFDIMTNFQEIAEDRGIFNHISWTDSEDFDRKYPDNSVELTAFRRVVYFWETLGEATFNGLLDRDMVFLQMGTGAFHYWQKIESLIYELRENNDIDETDYLYFEWFYLESQKVFPQAGKRLISKTNKLRAEIKPHN